MAKFAMDPGAVTAAATTLDGLAGQIRALTLSTKIATLATAIPDTANVTSPIVPVANGADATVTTAIDHCGGQVEAFGALVRVAATSSVDTDDFNATRFDDAGQLPTVAAWDPGNTKRPAKPHE
ncbi:hypothetical protein ACWDTD_10085 [Gordonia sp. NPDC003425]